MISRTAFTFFHPLRVRWAECDPQGIVFNVNYFLYFDVAMTEYMRALGYEGAASPEFFTVRAEADYRAPARFDETVEIGVRCIRLGRASMALELAIFRAETLLTEGRMTYVHAERGGSSSVPLPESLVGRILAFETTPPERAPAGAGR